MTDPEREREFNSRIDCCFPYRDSRAARELIAEACEIGANAAFMVAHELARPGRHADAPAKLRLESLMLLRSTFVHPLAEPVLSVAERMIGGEELSIREAMALMNRIADHVGSYNALAIAYFSCNDVSGEADDLYDAILLRWKEGA